MRIKDEAWWSNIEGGGNSQDDIYSVSTLLSVAKTENTNSLKNMKLIEGVLNGVRRFSWSVVSRIITRSIYLARLHPLPAFNSVSLLGIYPDIFNSYGPIYLSHSTAKCTSVAR